MDYLSIYKITYHERKLNNQTVTFLNHFISIIYSYNFILTVSFFHNNCTYEHLQLKTISKENKQIAVSGESYYYRLQLIMTIITLSYIYYTNRCSEQSFPPLDGLTIVGPEAVRGGNTEGISSSSSIADKAMRSKKLLSISSSVLKNYN